MWNARTRLALVLVCGVLPREAPAQPDTPAERPLPRAHAHNDYAHPRPLFDALAQGFCSVEADVHLVDGRLLVAHDRWRVKPERTLEALYLEPLQTRVRTNGGRVFATVPTFWLLVDFKSDGAATWPVLRATLERFRPMLSVFESGRMRTNAVTVVLSGNVPRALLAAESERLAAVDGRPPDLDENPVATLVPWVSESWGRLFSWRGDGPMPEAERVKLWELVTRAHAQGRRVRFWGASDFEPVWRVQWEAGVDLINTDRLAALAQFLNGLEAPAGQP
jgi:glycerophosphoryl diester phosphodiesterase